MKLFFFILHNIEAVIMTLASWKVAAECIVAKITALTRDCNIASCVVEFLRKVGRMYTRTQNYCTYKEKRFRSIILKEINLHSVTYLYAYLSLCSDSSFFSSCRHIFLADIEFKQFISWAIEKFPLAPTLITFIRNSNTIVSVAATGFSTTPICIICLK